MVKGVQHLSKKKNCKGNTIKTTTGERRPPRSHHEEGCHNKRFPLIEITKRQ